MSLRRPVSSSTGSARRVRRYASRSPTRSRKRRYSVKQPSAMCCPLSGGGSGSPSRAGKVCTAPPSVGRASCTVTSTPASSRSSAAARPASPPPTTATLIPLRRRQSRRLRSLPAPSSLRGSSKQPPRDDRELRRSGKSARGAEDVEPVRLHAIELAGVETGERRHAERAPPVERVEQAQPLLDVHACALRLKCHERLPRGRDAI